MFEAIVLGFIQGLAEWIPISSEGFLVLAQIHFFGETSLVDAVELSLFLHLGTFFAAFAYFYKDIFRIMSHIFSYRKNDGASQREARFYIIATIISGILGWVFFFIFSNAVEEFSGSIELGGRIVTGGVAILLFITAGLGFMRKAQGIRNKDSLSFADGIILGIVQGFSVLPGLSRSGTTVAAFLLRGFEDASALRLSFIMSLPIVLAGNIFLQLNNFAITIELIAGLSTAFVVGLGTIHILLRIAQKVRFAWFVLFFACVTVVSLFF
ncbi:MAG: undecaprenyl-diphosphate phosphatase [bacterium]|nr:undecaprenyl-diphosphate phosphatase [bacterium]